jgi:triosephosphate isomerase
VAEPATRSPKILGASLKLYLDVARTAVWAGAVAEIARTHPAVESGAVRLFVLPSLPAVPVVAGAMNGTPVEYGAQDLHWEDRGAFTGAVSGTDLYDIGCRLVEVGHAERKNVFGEDAEVVDRKFRAALRNGLTPVFCVGEAREGTPEDAASECIRQLDSAFSGAELEGREVIVAYEPEWAIGAPQPASADHVRSVAAALRERLAAETTLRSSAVIYGGSAQPGTLTALGDSVDGLFLGRFAHDPAAFAQMVDEAAAIG